MKLLGMAESSLTVPHSHVVLLSCCAIGGILALVSFEKL